MDFKKPLIMGILNLTPNSFSDGGRFNAPEVAKKRVLELMEEGADIIDIGGESTGPGAPIVSEAEEFERVKPIIDWIHEQKLTEKGLFSIDTYKAPIVEYAVQHGFQIVNDFTGLRGDPKMIDILLKYKPYVVLMHSKAFPHAISEPTEYEDIIQVVKDFLQKTVKKLLDEGFPREKIIVDPGMGTCISSIPKYSFEIIEKLEELKALGYPILVGISRKSCLGGKLEERDKASIEWSIKAIQNGANIVRVHDVGMMKNQLSV